MCEFRRCAKSNASTCITKLEAGWSIGLHAEAGQILEDAGFAARYDAGWIKVFNADEPATLGFPGLKVAAHGRDQRAKVEIAGR